VKAKLETDPMYRLEHGIKDKKILDQTTPHLTQLQSLNESQWSDPYAKSQLLRKQFRTEKKLEKAKFEATEKLRDKHSLQIELLPEIPSDIIGAKSVEYNAQHVLNKKRLETAVKPLFDKNSSKKEGDQHLKELSHMAKIHTRLKVDPFYNPRPFSSGKLSSSSSIPNTTMKLNDVKVVKPSKKKIRNNDGDSVNSSALLVSYPDSESD
jgi:coiled-coil domain-containing protein 130